jgi:hypothetical protein
MSTIHQCRCCNTVFSSKYLLNKHSMEIHQETCTVGGNIVQRIDSLFKCPSCSKTFVNAEYFRKHYKIHSREIDPSLVEINESDTSRIPGETSNESEIGAQEQDRDLFRSIALDELQLKFNLKYSLLICSSCNVGVKKCGKYLYSHFTNKSHSKKKVC